MSFMPCKPGRKHTSENQARHKFSKNKYTFFFESFSAGGAVGEGGGGGGAGGGGGGGGKYDNCIDDQ